MIEEKGKTNGRAPYFRAGPATRAPLHGLVSGGVSRLAHHVRNPDINYLLHNLLRLTDRSISDIGDHETISVLIGGCYL